LRTIRTSTRQAHRRRLRTLFRGQVINGTVGWGALIGVALIVAGMAFGTRTFQRDSA
jgi:hypothetical protein